MLNLISIVVEVLFACAVAAHMLIINKSISRLEYKFEELDDEVFKNLKESKVKVEEAENTTDTVEQVVKKRRTRKPKISKEIA